MSQSFFVAGTGTDVGKTYFASLFLAKYGTELGYKYWKPIQSGFSQGDDTTLVRTVTNLDDSYFLKPIYSLNYASSPHLAAKKQNIEIDPRRILQEMNALRSDRVMIEGAGGIFVPLTEDYLFWQLIRESNLKVIVVCSSELGTINHTLMTLECLMQRYIPVVGFYMVGPRNELINDNIKMIQKLGGAPSLGYTNFPEQKLTPIDFISFAKENFDLEKHVIDSVLDADLNFAS